MTHQRYLRVLKVSRMQYPITEKYYWKYDDHHGGGDGGGGGGGGGDGGGGYDQQPENTRTEIRVHSSSIA